MSDQPTLKKVLDKLKAVGENMPDAALVDVGGILPAGDHHQTAIFIRLPYPGAGDEQHVKDRVGKLLFSVNRPDTIKCDVWTICGNKCAPGWQPNLTPDSTGKGLFDHEKFMESGQGYTLQITVDIVHPAVLSAALGQEVDMTKLLLGHKGTYVPAGFMQGTGKPTPGIAAMAASGVPSPLKHLLKDEVAYMDDELDEEDDDEF